MLQYYRFVGPTHAACNVSLKYLGKWFRGPALRLFGTTRIPRLHCDTLIGPANEKNHWVHVMFREWSYRILVYNKSGTRISPATLENALAAVVSDVRGREAARESCLPVGRLTADHRDTWARVSQRRRNYRCHSRLSLFASESGASSVLVPHECGEYGSVGNLSLHCFSGRLHLLHHKRRVGALLGHIRNISSGVDATNRWFDKSMSLIVESNARFGIMGEHSPVDALIPSIIADWAVSEPIDLSVFAESHSESEKMFELLAWRADQYISSECHLAKERAGAIINDSDANVLRFHEYGIGWIKETGVNSAETATTSLTMWEQQPNSPPMHISRWPCNWRGSNQRARSPRLMKLHRPGSFCMVGLRQSGH
jgi:carnitine O-acetyltransferase